MKSKVYFTTDFSPEKLIELYERCGVQLSGKVAAKVHSGEVGNQNFLRPDFWKPVIDHVNGTVIETNTAYDGQRGTSEKHWKTMEFHGWSHYFDVDILDDGCEDIVLPIENGKRIDKHYVGGHLANYDSVLFLSHFKGHPRGGFGGALKQLAIGLASAFGKKNVHGCGDTENFWYSVQEDFVLSMADAAAAAAKHLQGKAVYINVMRNMSVDCDCVAVAEDPCMQDIGMLASTDPVALDKACIDLVYASKDPGRDHLVERIESRKGLLIFDSVEEMGAGSTDYECIKI